SLVELPSGHWLAAGGVTTGTIFSGTAEVLDSGASAWTAASPMPSAHRGTHSGVLLPSGEVLIAGEDPHVGGHPHPRSAYRYDEVSGSWARTANDPSINRFLATMTLLPDGRVLMAAGYNGHSSGPTYDSAEIYDPATDSWSVTGFMAEVRAGHSATLLTKGPDAGKVLVVGGSDRAPSNLATTGCEIYDPATGTWSATGSLNESRSQHTATLLPSGEILVAGGQYKINTETRASAELYDPLSGTWALVAPMSEPRAHHSATLLPSGQILIAGGSTVSNGSGVLSTTEIYDSTLNTWSPAPSLTTSRILHGAALLADSRVIVIGGQDGGTRISSTEILTLDDPAPGLTIADDIPAAEGEQVDVNIDFTAGSVGIAATTFSVDYDQACLDFDDTDANPVDGLPDAIEILVPGDFSVTVFHDLGDDDGEIDIAIADFNPPIATLPDGPLVRITFTTTCSPALGSTISTPVVFSADPAATFSDDLAQDVPGTTTDGSVRIYPGPRGDCNGNGLVTAADLVAAGLEIFDGDGSLWVDAPGGTFVGSPVGCDANADTHIDAGDVSCTIRLIFGGTCGGGNFSAGTASELRIDGSPIFQTGETIRIPVRLHSHGVAISSLAFSLDFDPVYLRFVAGDQDQDGMPDAVHLAGLAPDLTSVQFDHRDGDGEIDFLLSLTDGSTFPDGVLVEIELRALRRGRLSSALRFSDAPPASFGTLSGASAPGQTLIER
ncbi:MAG: kelch repeat-containing protein, partial [Acidobacteriota bacterium]